MNVETHHDAYEEGECPAWAWPLYAFVALLASLFNHITKLKRVRHTTKFKPDWRDSWQDLRHSEWLRDQLIALGVAQLLAGKPLQLDDTKIALAPPATYGGPCPRTPFDMNRRFLAIARWAADPEEIIRARYNRLIARLGFDPANPLASHGSTGALRAAHHEAVGVAASKAGRSVALMVSSARSARPSNHEGVLANARGPPPFPKSGTRIPCASHARERPCTPRIDICPRLHHLPRILGGHRHEAREARLIPRVVSLLLRSLHVSQHHARSRRRQNARRPHAL